MNRLQLVHAASFDAASVAIFPGGFNPPTQAHLALAEAALSVVDAVYFVLPSSFPHKQYDGASLDQRLSMLSRLAAANPRLGIGLTRGGLYIDMVRETRAALPNVTVRALCGRDAAERIVSWDYGAAYTIESMMEEVRLLVAARRGAYSPPQHLAHAIELLDCPDYGDYSSTELRDAIAVGGEWRHLAPEHLHGDIERIYSGAPPISRNALSL